MCIIDIDCNIVIEYDDNDAIIYVVIILEISNIIR